MSERFIKFIPSEKTEWLIKKNSYAFCLLCLIASRARRYSGHLDGLEIGEAHIGNWKSYGMSQQNYRTAKDLLCKLNIIKIIETNRNRKNPTTGVTTLGTKVKLLNSDIWDINIESANDSSNDDLTTPQRRTRKKERKKEEEQASCAIFFDRVSSSFVGITQKDRDAWQVAFPHVNLDREFLIMRSWLLSEKGQERKGTRQFIDKWISQAHTTTLPKIIQPESKECEIDPFVKAKVKERFYENAI